jgi:hypothetical protein
MMQGPCASEAAETSRRATDPDAALRDGARPLAG